MRKLWPATYDDFSIRFWAAMVSICLNFTAGLLSYLGHTFELLAFFAPGFFPVMPIIARCFEQDCSSWLLWTGLTVGAAANVVFYYLVARWFIGAFQPEKSWWPEKRS